jgi:hypothetical protein
MKTLHLITGSAVVFIFLLTGQYMDFHTPRMDELNDGTRMMLRSRHIYILLAGLLNLGLGSYLVYREQSWRRILQIIGSGLIIVAPFVLLGAFFHEPKLAGLPSSLTLAAVVALLTGTIFHSLSGTRQSRSPLIKEAKV